MRKILVTTCLSLDGVMQTPGGPEEDPSGGFEHGGWSVNYWDDLMGRVMTEATTRPFAMLLGRTTYEIMAAYWPTPEPSGAFGQEAAMISYVLRPSNMANGLVVASAMTRPIRSSQ